MAQTQPQQFASQQSFSPPVSSPSPSAAPSPVNGGIPPQKRQQFSPLPQSQTQSPYASPSFGTLQLPQTQSPTMNGTNMNGMAPTTPAPPPPPGAMGPPSRPVEKATDAAELTDVLASSGIDVREEEAFLTSSYSGPGVQAQQPPRPQQPPPPQQQHHLQQQQPPPANLSFTSQPSTTGTISSAPSFNEPSQLKPPTTQDSFYTEPASSQPPAPFKDPNEPTREDTEAARRAQYHLQEPFLLTKVLEQKLQRRGFELGVRIPAEGLFHPVPGRPQPIEVTGPDGSSVVRTGQTILNQEGAPLVDILNLMSISCEERLRNVIDYSSTLARSRRAHSHGAVPVEWKDVASSAAPTNGHAETPKATPIKRSHSETEQQSKRTLPQKYRMLMDRDNSYEEIRAAKRAKRSANAILGESAGSRSDSVDMPGSGASTPIGEKTPSFDKKGVTKKEARKMHDAKASEAQQHQQSVETARMATNSMLSGRMFGTKKSYSWLNRGPATGSGFSTPSRVNTATPAATPDKPGKSGEPAAAPTRRLGAWREDKEKGSGIQVRDILFMLELDGRGSRHIQKAYSKDVKEDRLD
ncbi:hypothetical protein ASPWEDRAFT_51045 [Aspergillus wentii DTO 134E9]|uniref:Transcription initiation factor TFIID subunit 4 n=1 Tax=Aspergillus wentii DTO 134E9 TaxID=1073089 RepID=A0A1L9RIN6_ASPWE|nr:uncharacterized protein ASPWEDRAFT_51045 [Aspergillus wentii DTO 134E9]KAI9932278.1 hypothetical protein MW887_009789 [Aspergillus wentii]OJJ34761.1 hypothetical protein ASPWEDRAFT_51045 [Aspergillus wentii DTO 134E9]